MKAIKFRESILIAEQADIIFDLTQDYNKRLCWDTFLRKAEVLYGAKTAGKGVKTYCEAKNGLGMETEYVSFNRPKVVAIKMTKGPYLFKSFYGSWNFKAIDKKITEVVFLYSFSFRFPFNLANVLIKAILRREVKTRLKDLRAWIENLKRENEELI